MNHTCVPAARRWAARCAVLALAAAPAIASAVLVTGPGGTAEQGRRTVVTPPAPSGAASAPAFDLVTARLDAVDSAAARVLVNGLWVPLHTAALRVIGSDGRQQAGASALKAGQQIRFALEPGTAALRRIVLIYIDR